MATLFAEPFHKERRGSSQRERSLSLAPDEVVPIPGSGQLNSIGHTHSKRDRKKFILCFDGTGNKFSGTDADSNILKIYRMLDRDDSSQFHYYQPGIGTYVQSSSLSHSSRFERAHAAYTQAKDSAIGTSFDEHVMGGYKFLMRYYNVGDEIYLFGFSRGAYTARFLAEMLDHVGLLSAGNEEMSRFAWRCFQQWQQRTDRTEREKLQKKALLNYMMAFRETFSRPVSKIRFLGLFDTVNSVPQFENAFLQRSKFPYTARSTAKVIRHAVAIDERRAKFRQDLIGETRPSRENHYRRRHTGWKKGDELFVEKSERSERGRRPSKLDVPNTSLVAPPRFRDPSEMSGVRSLSPRYNLNRIDRMNIEDPDQRSEMDDGLSDVTHDSLDYVLNGEFGDSDSDDDEEQDIQEVWFPGCHADIGGGWPLGGGEDTALSHIPLVWMVREAERAGLKFDPKKVRDLNCCEEVYQTRRKTLGVLPIPQIEVEEPTSPEPYSDLMPPMLDQNGHAETKPPKTGKITVANVGAAPSQAPDLSEKAEIARASRFVRALDSAAMRGKMHDVLQFNNGSPPVAVVAWNFMEYLPFRRMDLQPDGSWKSINWPLPKGEVRDIPNNVVIHNSVIKRMHADPSYRPGNLIVGGGGRGVRTAPREYGMGKWKILQEAGDPVGEVFVRDGPAGPLINGANVLKKRNSWRHQNTLVDELLRDLEDLVKLIMAAFTYLLDLVFKQRQKLDRRCVEDYGNGDLKNSWGS